MRTDGTLSRSIETKTLRLDRDEEAPSLWAVWTLGDDGEIIGSGDTAGEALAEARHTLEVWRENRRLEVTRAARWLWWQGPRPVSALAFTRSR